LRRDEGPAVVWATAEQAYDRRRGPIRGEACVDRIDDGFCDQDQRIGMMTLAAVVEPTAPNGCVTALAAPVN
jgi:hypothetical protein